MLATIIRILFCLALCLMLLACPGDPKIECVKTQDVVLIRATHGVSFDSLVVRKDNKVMKCNVIGSQTHNVKFPVNINIQFFLLGTQLQSLDINITANSILTFYNSNACDGMSRGDFYPDMQEALNNGIFIDSYRSEIACWIMTQMTEDHEYIRCTKTKDGIIDVCYR